MGNRLSRKKRASAAPAAPSQEVVHVVAAPAPSSAAPVNAEARKDEDRPKHNEAEQPPLSARQVPPTARDDGEEDPVEFFRRCYALEADPFMLYTQALLLKDRREFAAASELLRSLLPNASLTLEARHHLAQCLIAQDPALSWCYEEATQCLEDVVAATKASSNNADAHIAVMHREGLELLAHLMIARRRFDRALQLLDSLQTEINVDGAVFPSERAARRQQQTLVSFQRAFCRYARGDSPEAVSSELQLPTHDEKTEQEPETADPLEGIELLLHADAAGLREGLALLAATSH